MTGTLSGINDKPLASTEKKAKRLLDLPTETINLVFDQFEDYELPTVMCVSRAFRDLSAAQLYRTIHYTFSDEEAENSVELLASILETLASSNYDYAAHVKEIHITSAALGVRGGRAYRDYLYSGSGAKFLNLTLLMVLKRTIMLETFDWDVRIELGPSVLAKLSTTTSLRHLNVRFQAGSSLHSKPWIGPENANIPASQPPASAGWNHTVATDLKNAPYLVSDRQSNATVPFSRFRNLTSFGALEIDTLEYVPDLAECIRASSESLKHLALSFSENMARKARESLGVTSDTEPTISDGEPSDNGMSASHLGNQENNAETWQMARDAQEAALAKMLGLQMIPETSLNPVGVEKMVSQADKEVFDQIKLSYRNERDKEFVESIREVLRTATEASDRKDVKSSRFVDKLERAAIKYLERSDFSPRELRRRKDAANDKTMPKKPSSKPPKVYQFPTYAPPGTQPGLSPGTYIPSSHPDEMWVTPTGGATLPPAVSSQSHHYSMPGPSNPMSAKYFAGPSSSWVPTPQKHTVYGHGFHVPPEAIHPMSSSSKSKKSLLSTSSSSSLLSGSSTQIKSSSPDRIPKSKERSSPLHKKEDEKPAKLYDDDIDIDHPDDLGEEIEDQVFIDNEGAVNEASQPSKAKSSDESRMNGDFSLGGPDSITYQPKGKSVVRDQNGLPENNAKRTNASDNLSEYSKSSSSTTKPEVSSIREYLRLSHGLALESIALHRIPVKPSILFRAVDVSRLKHLTLLDVGPQRAAWAMLSKINKSSPLHLKLIHTNNVTHSLLVFLNGLEPGTLEELYLHEASSRHRSASTQKTYVTVEEIRKQALKKHIETLRVLMIRNDDDNSWSLDRETTRLLSHASKLRELVVALNSETFHLLLRHFPKLAQLHALHVIYQPKTYQHVSSSQVPHSPPNPVNIVVNQAPPIPMHHPPHPPSQYPSSTRMSPQAKEALLVELRAAIIDAVALCQQTELEWLGLSYGTVETRGDVRLAKLFNWRSEKDSSNDNELENPEEECSSTEGVENDYMDDVIGMEDWIPMAEAEAQIWDKGVWTGKL